MFPHIKNQTVAQDVAEAVIPNLYKCLIIPPVGIIAPAWLEQEIVSIDGLDKVDELPKLATQKAKGGTRIYSTSYLDDTTTNLTLVINLNAHGVKANDLIIYKMLKQIADRHRNNLTGQNSLKKDCIFKILLDQNNAVGEIWRHLEFKRCLMPNDGLKGLNDAKLDAGEPIQLTFKAVSEEFDLVMGGDNTVTP